MTVSDYFASSYIDSRRKFLTAACEAGAEVTTYILDDLNGPDEEELAIDVARLGPKNAVKLLMVISGTHGVEGFCGSGCQVGYCADRLYEILPANTAALLVHALNPFGFAWRRRVDECNIDLNRNFRNFSIPPPPSAAYEAVHDWLIPGDWDGIKRQEAETALAKYVADHGLRALQAAVQGGQYSKPNGLFYGGKRESWSNRTFQRLIAEHVRPNVNNLAVLDLHTGLGPPGYGEPIYLGPDATLPRARDWYGPEVKSTADGSAVAATVTGSVADGLSMIIPTVKTTFVALEYGTVPIIDVLTALRADHWLHDVPNRETNLAGMIKQQIKAAFFVDTPSWKAAIYGRFADFCFRACRGLGRD